MGVPKRAASVRRAGTPSLSIRREVGSSSRDGQPRHVKIVHAGGVAAGDLGLFVVRHALQDLPRSGKRRLAMRIVRTPHHLLSGESVIGYHQVHLNVGRLEKAAELLESDLRIAFLLDRGENGELSAFGAAQVGCKNV
jgi:hypothetical protein